MISIYLFLFFISVNYSTDFTSGTNGVSLILEQAVTILLSLTNLLRNKAYNQKKRDKNNIHPIKQTSLKETIMKLLHPIIIFRSSPLCRIYL